MKTRANARGVGGRSRGGGQAGRAAGQGGRRIWWETSQGLGGAAEGQWQMTETGGREGGRTEEPVREGKGRGEGTGVVSIAKVKFQSWEERRNRSADKQGGHREGQGRGSEGEGKGADHVLSRFLPAVVVDEDFVVAREGGEAL